MTCMRTLLAAPPPKQRSHTNFANSSGYVRPKKNKFQETLTFKNSRILNPARVPGKPISTNVADRGLNLANRGINVIPRLDSVPESTINFNLGMNYVFNLTHLARSINSQIGRKIELKTNKIADLLLEQIREKKFREQEIDLDQFLNEELRNRDRFGRESIKYLVEMLKDDLQRRGENEEKACVAGAKRGGEGRREKRVKEGKREGSACFKNRCFCIPPIIF